MKVFCILTAYKTTTWSICNMKDWENMYWWKMSIQTHNIVTWWQIRRIHHQNSASVVRTVTFNTEKLYFDYTQNLDNIKVTEGPKCSQSNVDHTSGKSTMSHVRLDNHGHSPSWFVWCQNDIRTPDLTSCRPKCSDKFPVWHHMGQKNLDKLLASSHVGQSISKRFLVCPYMGQNESQTLLTCHHVVL